MAQTQDYQLFRPHSLQACSIYVFGPFPFRVSYLQDWSGHWASSIRKMLVHAVGVALRSRGARTAWASLQVVNPQI